MTYSGGVLGGHLTLATAMTLGMDLGSGGQGGANWNTPTKVPNQVGGRIYKELPGPNRVGGARTRTRCALRTAWGLGRGQANRLHPPPRQTAAPIR